MALRSISCSGLALAGLLTGLVGCLDRPAAPVDPRLQSGIEIEIANHQVDKVDVLFVVDNSNSMAANQAQLAAQFNTLLGGLIDPHTDCDHDGQPDYPPVHDMHIAVVDSDLGAPGIPGALGSCTNGPGDDGLMNPIRYGAS